MEKTNRIRVGTYNTGDFSGDNVPAGSELMRYPCWMCIWQRSCSGK